MGVKLKYRKYITKRNKEEKIRYWLPLFLSVVFFIISTLLAFLFFSHETRTAIKLSEESINETIRLSEESLNYTFWSTKPVTLKVIHFPDEESGRWYINVTNTHPLRSTGSIYLYQLEKSGYKPQMLIEDELKPGETQNFTLDFKVEKKNVTYIQERTYYGYSLIPPFVKTYYINNHISLTFKITCDNCPPHGVIRRLPNFGSVDFRMIRTKGGITSVSIPVYSWTDYQLDDILKE